MRHQLFCKKSDLKTTKNIPNAFFALSEMFISIILSFGRKLLQLLYAVLIVYNRNLQVSVLAAKLVDKVLNIHPMIEIHLID